MGRRDIRAEKVMARDVDRSEPHKCNIRAQSVQNPEYSVTGEEQCALTMAMTLPDASHFVCFGIHICFTICSTTICGA